MLDGTSSSGSVWNRSASAGASLGAGCGRVGASTQCECMWLPASRSSTLGATGHPLCAGAGCELGGCTSCRASPDSAGNHAAPGGTERAASLARLDVASGLAERIARSHVHQAASAAVSLVDLRACGGSAADLEASRGLASPLASSRAVSPQHARRGHTACQAPWHPKEGRCAVTRAGPEAWARWAAWGRASTSSGHAPGSARALRLAHTHTIVCACCGDLVPLQKARTAARLARRSTIAPSDGCYGCGRHGRKTRREQRQSKMALAVLVGARVLLETPPSDAARVELWMLPRSSAEAHARRVLAHYEPQGLGRWLVHACRHGL